jgi:hypothetical protein
MSVATKKLTIQDGVLIFSRPRGYKRQFTAVQFTPVHKEIYRVQSSEDRSEDSSARKGSSEYRNQKTEFRRQK